MTDDQMREEIREAGRRCGLPEASLGTYCRSQRDGDCDCDWVDCPQLKDGEPRKSGRHCPLDIHEEERGYQ